MFGLKKKSKMNEQEMEEAKNTFVNYLESMNIPADSVKIENSTIVIGDETESMFINGLMKRSLNGKKKTRIKIK